MSAEGYKYYVLYNGEQKLARTQGILNAYVFHHESGWQQADHIARHVTGLGGDADFDEITEVEARERFPKAF